MEFQEQSGWWRWRISTCRGCNTKLLFSTWSVASSSLAAAYPSKLCLKSNIFCTFSSPHILDHSECSYGIIYLTCLVKTGCYAKQNKGIIVTKNRNIFSLQLYWHDRVVDCKQNQENFPVGCFTLWSLVMYFCRVTQASSQISCSLLYHKAGWVMICQTVTYFFLLGETRFLHSAIDFAAICGDES